MISRPFLYLLLAAALFMRVLVPQGYMPERSADGGIAVTLCGSDGVWLIPLKDGAAPEDKSRRSDQPCAFAGVASAAVPPPAIPELALPAESAVAYSAGSAPAGQFSAAHLRPPARGPPLTA